MREFRNACLCYSSKRGDHWSTGVCRSPLRLRGYPLRRPIAPTSACGVSAAKTATTTEYAFVTSCPASVSKGDRCDAD